MVHSIQFCRDFFDPKKEFYCYDHWEVFDFTKTYTEQEQVLNFGKGFRCYLWCRIDVQLEKGIQKGTLQHYIVLEEQVEKKEMQQLAKHCQCDYHKSYWWQKLVTCRCCCGCLESVFPSAKVVFNTRRFIACSCATSSDSYCKRERIEDMTC